MQMRTAFLDSVAMLSVTSPQARPALAVARLATDHRRHDGLWDGQ